MPQIVVFVPFQAAVIHPCHLPVAFQVFGYFLRIGTVARHPQVQRFESEVQQKSVLRRLDRAQVAHQLRGRLGDIGQLAEIFRIGQSVIRSVGTGQSGVFVRMGFPIEIAAVDDRAANAGRMAVHIFGRRVRHDVGPPLDRAAVDRRGERIVHDQRYAVTVRDPREFLDIQHGYAGIGYRFAEQRFGIRTERPGDLLLGSVLIDERHLDAQFRQRHAEQVIGSAVDRRRADDVVAGRTDVEHGIERSGLARRGQHAGYAAFERSDLRRYRIVGRVLQPGIEVAALFQIEQPGHLFARLVFERGALINRQHAGLAFFGSPSRLNAKGPPM